MGLLKELVIADFKLKYSRSILGFFWSLLKPLLFLGTFYVVFSMLMKWNIPHYQLFLLLGIILWTFFSEATLGSMSSMLSKANLIKSTNFRKSIIVLSTCISAFLTLLLNLFVFGIFMAISKATLGWHSLLFPLLLLQLFLVSFGLALGLSALHVKYRDMQHIWEVILFAGFWITPIVYSIKVIPTSYLKFYMLNPIARIINDSRDAIIFHSSPSFLHITITFLLCLAIFFVGTAIFKKMSPYFVEHL